MAKPKLIKNVQLKSSPTGGQMKSKTVLLQNQPRNTPGRVIQPKSRKRAV